MSTPRKQVRHLLARRADGMWGRRQHSLRFPNSAAVERLRPRRHLLVAIRRAAVLQRIPTITTIAAARAAAEGIQALQKHTTKVNALQYLHAQQEAVK